MQNGLMILPPPLFPFGGQIKRINTSKLDEYRNRELIRLIKSRSLSKYNHHTVKINS
jgi:hypothetical protein